ncbi:TPA: hypothetical protein O7Y06_004817, partial [Salmonella enterica]|nr:hypothetical protein [Salmonella enterica]HDC2224888.1 hypothetical protein [Salmonella enterica]
RNPDAIAASTARKTGTTSDKQRHSHTADEKEYSGVFSRMTYKNTPYVFFHVYSNNRSVKQIDIDLSID